MRKFVYALLFAVILFDMPIFIGMTAKSIYKYKKEACIEQCIKQEARSANDCEYICKYER